MTFDFTLIIVNLASVHVFIKDWHKETAKYNDKYVTYIFIVLV